MICVSSQCACAEAISGTKRRPASKHISFESSRRAENLSSAHRLVEISTRYRRFTSAHAQLRNSSPISSEFADSYAARRDESNDMCLVSGGRFVPEINYDQNYSSQ